MFARLVVDEEVPGEAHSSGERDRPEVDSERHPQLASRSHPSRTSCLELAVQADRLLIDSDGATVLIGEVEAPVMLHVRLIPGHSDSNSDGDVLRSRSNYAKAAAENKQLARGYLYGIAH